MKWNPINLRRLDYETPEGFSIRDFGSRTLILVKSNGDVQFGNAMFTKDPIVSSYIEGEDLLLLAWTGEWRTDIFLITRDDLLRWYDPKKKGIHKDYQQYHIK